MIKQLSESTQKMINEYLHLPIANRDVACPYCNNRRSNLHGGLRALIGKGTPADIAEEALIISLRNKENLKNMDDETLKQFLVYNKLGVDCSAFYYHVMDAEYKARGLGKLKKYIKFPYIKNPLRQLLAKLRNVEHAGVRTLAHEKNSTEVELKKIQPGDMIIMIGTGANHNFNHILLVAKIEMENELPTVIHYCHSFAWTSDGPYRHGVKSGKIIINDCLQNLLAQKWIEQDKTGTDNETFLHAKEAQILKIKRLNKLYQTLTK